MGYPICNDDPSSLQFYSRQEQQQQQQSQQRQQHQPKQPDVIQKDKIHQEIQAQKDKTHESEQKKEPPRYESKRKPQLVDQQSKSSEMSFEGKGFNTSLSFNTPDSSQTDSEGISPQVRNKHKYTRDFLPKFSISIEDDQNRFVNQTL